MMFFDDSFYKDLLDYQINLSLDNRDKEKFNQYAEMKKKIEQELNDK